MYKDVWGAAEGEVLPCAREGNIQDTFAVAVKKSSTTVGHVPRKVSAICSMFLRRGGSIVCRVVGGKRYSRDLPQGGIDVFWGIQASRQSRASIKRYYNRNGEAA